MFAPRAVFLFVATYLLVPTHRAVAQPTASTIPAAESSSTTVTAFARNLSRVELWSFFTPPPGGGHPDYSFVGNRLTFGVQASGRRWDAAGAFQYIQLWGLPGDANGPGPLGTGALYYAATGSTKAYQLYPREMFLRLKEIRRGVSLTAGRFRYASGAEASSNVASLEFLKRERLDSRLVGPFEWSIVQRAFDGVRVDLDRKGWQATAVAGMPSQGGFEESATPTNTGVQVAVGSVTFRPHVVVPWSELQLFSALYRDRRSVAARPDNTGEAASGVDVRVWSVGASQAGIFPTVDGEADSIVWLVGQGGTWYGQSHRAFSVAAEIGHRWTAIPWRPWLRVGGLYASGDADPSDARHGTFFQMLPDSQRYSRTATFAQMNVRDLFAQGFLYPHAKVSLRTELHHVDLARAADAWYSGSGATARSGSYFGYVARPSAGEAALGTVLDQGVDVHLHRRWSMNAYVGLMWGGAVVRTDFPGDRLAFVYLENVIAF